MGTLEQKEGASGKPGKTQIKAGVYVIGPTVSPQTWQMRPGNLRDYRWGEQGQGYTGTVCSSFTTSL